MPWDMGEARLRRGPPVENGLLTRRDGVTRTALQRQLLQGTDALGKPPYADQHRGS